MLRYLLDILDIVCLSLAIGQRKSREINAYKATFSHPRPLQILKNRNKVKNQTHKIKDCIGLLELANLPQRQMVHLSTSSFSSLSSFFSRENGLNLCGKVFRSMQLLDAPRLLASARRCSIARM